MYKRVIKEYQDEVDQLKAELRASGDPDIERKIAEAEKEAWREVSDDDD